MRKQCMILVVSLLAFCGAARAAETLAYTAAELKQAEELLVVMGVPKQMQEMTQMMLSAQTANHPQAAALRGILEPFFQKYISYDALKGDMAIIYAETFTGPELKELIALFKTPIGKKFVERNPELSARGAALGQKRIQEHLPELIERLRTLDKPAAPAPVPAAK